MKNKAWKLVLPFAVAAPLAAAYVGGWATITVENLPDYLVAGQPTNVTFSVRQHGFRLMGDLSPTIEARSGKLEQDARGVATNREGYYTATVNVPQTGNWELTIQSGFGPRSKVTLLPIPAVASAARPVVARAETDRGQRLFVAKGCVSCHVNNRVKGSGIWQVDAPDLTDRQLPKEYLQQFLANPAMKTRNMPNLNLKPDEIAALIAFQNATGPVGKVTAGQ